MLRNSSSPYYASIKGQGISPKPASYPSNGGNSQKSFLRIPLLRPRVQSDEQFAPLLVLPPTGFDWPIFKAIFAVWHILMATSHYHARHP